MTAGVPESDMIEIIDMKGAISLPRNAKRSKYKTPHQNERECARRRKRLPVREKTAA